jgi:excinuclease ABC subunit C
MDTDNAEASRPLPGQHPLKARLPDVSLKPGVYLFKDSANRVVYVGKAKQLRKRLASYFRDDDAHSPKTRAMLRQACSLDTLVTATEKEALLLEASLIKKHKPRYNIVLRDDKQYILFKLEKNSEYPRLTLTRRVTRDGALFFGPFTSAAAARESWKAIHGVFPLRRCKDGAFKNRVRPCLYHQLGLCLAPCVRNIPRDEYARLVSRVEMLLAGRSNELVRALTIEMRKASDELDFERAGVLRDQIRALEKTLEQQVAVLPDEEDADVLGLAPVAKGAQIGLGLGLLFVRRGRLLDKKRFFWPKLGLEEGQEVLENFLAQYYGPERFIPEKILLPWDLEAAITAQPAPEDGLEHEAESREADGTEDAQHDFLLILARVLAERRGGPVRIVGPQRGVDKKLVDMAAENARQIAEEENAPLTSALAGVAVRLHLPGPPLHIECVDVSHTQGVQTRVGLVAFENGTPRKDWYRTYAFPELEGSGDDYAALAAWARRRLKAGPPWPDLLLVDGGKGQLAAVERALSQDGAPPCPLASIAKAREESDAGRLRRKTHALDDVIYLPGRKNPANLKPGSPELLFLQRVRDTAHNYVIGRHRRSRGKTALAGELLRLPGVGLKTARLLWDHFPSIEAMLGASLEAIEQLPGLGKKRAAALHARLQQLKG